MFDERAQSRYLKSQLALSKLMSEVRELRTELSLLNIYTVDVRHRNLDVRVGRHDQIH
jgi:hypothetical protein